MNTVEVELKDGRRFSGPLWTWRPAEGWFTLAGVANENGLIVFRLADCVSAVDRAQRVGINPDGTPKIEDVDLLQRARESGWEET